jgi:hypothetical protein
VNIPILISAIEAASIMLVTTVGMVVALPVSLALIAYL